MNIRKNDIPQTTIPWDIVKKARRKKFLIIGLFVGVVIAYYISMEYINQREAEELVPVILSNETIKPGTPLVNAGLQSISIPKQYVPHDALQSMDELKDAIAVIPLSGNQIVTSHHIRSDVDPNSVSGSIATGRDLFVIAEHWLESPIPDLGKGDRIDVITVDPKETKPQTRTIASGLTVLKVITKNSERMLAVELDDAQAKNLLLARAFRFPMSLIIHSR